MPASLAFLGNTVIAVAYGAITVAIAVPVVRAGQVRTNRLATATALIFFSCSIGHAFHALGAWSAIGGRTVMPGMAMPGMAMPSSDWGFPSAAWDLLTAVVAVYYWSLRRGYGVLLGRSGLYVSPDQQRLVEEVRAREQIAADQAESHRALLAAIVEQSDDAIVGTSLDGVVTAWNVGAERIFGYPAAEAIGTSTTSFAAPGSQPSQRDLLDRIVDGERAIRYEAQAVHKDGHLVDVAVTLSALLDRDGTVVGTSRVAHDLTAVKADEAARRANEEHLRRVQHMASLGRLAGGVAHDFNNLLGIILNFTAFATEDAVGLDGVRSDLTQVRLAAERGAELARQLLVFTRQDAVHPQLLDVNVSVLEAQAMLTRTIGEHIELIAVPHPAPLMVNADAGHLQQVLVNLVVNARDAMPDGGTIVIEASAVELDEQQENVLPAPAAGRYVRLLVSDTGTGMSREVAARIFEPFFTTKPQGSGTGLGLATVYGIVAEAGGSVNVYSELGVGTTFRVYFPLIEADDRAEAAVAALVPAPSGGGQTVLIVEDEPALGQSVARILDEHGYRTLSARNGVEALDLGARHRCDLLLTDVIMPEMSGRELAEALQRRQPGLPVLYMSGYTRDILDRGGSTDPGIVLIQKPFTAHDLLVEVDRVLTGKHAGVGRPAAP